MERDDYKFLKLKDAIVSINQKVNLIGVVLEFGFPRITQGTDYFCPVKIVDESYPQCGISVNLFMENVEDLPTFRSPGDIIQLFRVTMKAHKDGIYVLFNKKFSSFALYEGENGEDCVPYQCSSKFHAREHDSKLIASLRRSWIDFQVVEDGDTFSFLREIIEKEPANLVCKILHVSEIAKNKWMALVWDGTDSRPNSINTNPEHETGDELPLQLEPSPFPRDLLCTFPTVGTILRVIIDNVDYKRVLNVLNTGKWVKVISMLCEVRGGLWCGVWTAFTKLRCLSNEDHIMLACQRSYEERLSLKFGRIPYWCFPWCSGITEVDHEHAPFVSLMDILTYPEVTAKFKCMIRVVAALPWRVEDFSYHGMYKTYHGMYKIRLTIEDPTARIHAHVYADDGEKFFGGHPSVDILIRKRNKLLGVAEDSEGEETDNALRNPPWVQCCLKSYYRDKNDIWGSRHYRIFDTKIVG